MVAQTEEKISESSVIYKGLLTELYVPIFNYFRLKMPTFLECTGQAAAGESEIECDQWFL